MQVKMMPAQINPTCKSRNALANHNVLLKVFALIGTFCFVGHCAAQGFPATPSSNQFVPPIKLQAQELRSQIQLHHTSFEPTKFPSTGQIIPLKSEFEYPDGGQFQLLNDPFDLDRSQAVTTKRKIGTEIVHVEARDEIWLVSARDIPSENGVAVRNEAYPCSLLFGGQFIPVDLFSLAKIHREDTSKATVVYVHGNLTDLDYAKSRALQAYENLFRRQNTDGITQCRPAIRLVIYAWKSESEVSRPVADFKLKSQRSYGASDAFRHFLNQFHDRNLLLVGYSLGGQIVLKGAAESDANKSKPGRYDVALIAPALNPLFLENELGSISSNSLFKETTVFLNRNDIAIRLAHRILGTQSLIDVDPIAKSATSNAINPIRLVDITHEATRCHSIVKYTDCSAQLRQHVLNSIQTRCAVVPKLSAIENRQTGENSFGGHSTLKR